MKKVILFLLISLPSYAQQYFRLTGNISNLSQESIRFTLYPDWLGESKQYNLKLGSNGQFIIEFPLEEISYCDISFGEFSLNLFIIEPGDQINLRFDQKDFYGTIAVSGEGSSKWAYQLNNQIAHQGDELKLLDIQKLPQKEFLEKSRQLLEADLNKLFKYSDVLSLNFFNLQLADFYGKYKLYELGYLSKNNLPEGESSHFWQKFEEKTRVKSIQLVQLAEAIESKRLANFRYQGVPTLEFEEIKSLNTLFGIDLTEYLLAKKILDNINTLGVTEEIKLLIENFNSFSENDQFKNYIKEAVKKHEVLEIGRLSPNFILTNAKGKYVELKDYRGKNIFLGFYNDDCFFCKEDIKALEFAQAYFKNKKDLIFLLVNLSPKEVYKRYLITEKPIGIHLNGYENNSLKQNYNTSIVPNYLILDKNGKIVSNTIDEPRLDDSRLLIQFLENAFYKK